MTKILEMENVKEGVEGTAVADTNKPSYGQLEKNVIQAHQIIKALENKLRSIDYAALRLNYLFKVLENKDAFKAEFITKCAEEVEAILTIDSESTEEV